MPRDANAPWKTAALALALALSALVLGCSSPTYDVYRNIENYPVRVTLRDPETKEIFTSLEIPAQSEAVMTGVFHRGELNSIATGPFEMLVENLRTEETVWRETYPEWIGLTHNHRSRDGETLILISEKGPVLLPPSARRIDAGRYPPFRHDHAR